MILYVTLKSFVDYLVESPVLSKIRIFESDDRDAQIALAEKV